MYLADALIRLPDGTAQPLTATERALLQKLESNPSKPQYLLTVRGIGYKLAEENAQ